MGLLGALMLGAAWEHASDGIARWSRGQGRGDIVAAVINLVIGAIFVYVGIRGRGAQWMEKPGEERRL